MTERTRKRNSNGGPSGEPMEVEEPQNSDDEMNGIDHISDDEEGGIRIGDIYIPPPPKPALTFDSTGPRLIISKIVNVNFKSYAGKQVLGPFHKSFTAIIGPNGSGKSNVIDSMLFVFGCRASKIRSKKISVLIHNSKDLQNINSATVEVHFHQIIDGEGEDFEKVTDSDIVVSRTAFKDNTTHYTLNGKRVKFMEVSKILKTHGIDLNNNRFLILQGEVEQIAMMKPKGQTQYETGMLEYLEDIIGTSRYKVPIEQLSVKVEEFSELRKEKLNRVRLVETEKQRLEVPMKETVELINLTNAALRTKNTLLQKYIYEGRKVVENRAAELEQLKSKLNEIDEAINTNKNTLKEKNSELERGSKKYYDLKRKKDDILEKIQAVKRKLVSIQADTTNANKKRKNLEQFLTQEKNKLIELELVPQKNNRSIDECKVLVERHNQDKITASEEFQTVMAGVRSQTRELQEKKDKLQAQLIELNVIVDEATNIFKLAESELNIYVRTSEKEYEKMEKMKKDFDDASKKMEEKSRVFEELTTSLPDIESTMTETQQRLQQLKDAEGTIVTQIRSLRGQLEESKQTMSANRSRGRVLDSLMEQKRNGNIPGIYGRLGDLGGIDAKYDVAISTCCGALDNILVDTVDTAQACVQYLKDNNIGRGNFIALDKQEHFKSQYSQRRSYPENVLRLFDLVRVKDERVLPAFYYALRDTLVAKDLQQASRIGYGSVRYRMVTLKGDVVEIAGTMSGGGKTSIRGKMSSSVQQDTSEQHDPRAIARQEQTLASLEEQLSENRIEMATLEESLYPMQRSLQEHTSTLNKVKFELESLKGQVPMLREQIVQQEGRVARCKVDERQKTKLEKKMIDAQKKMDEATKNTGGIEAKVQEVDAEISSIAGGRVKELQSNIDSLSKKIDKVTKEITKFQVEINASVRNANRAKEKITQMENDLKETEANLVDLKESKKTNTLENTKLDKDLQEVEEQLNEGSGEFSGLKKEIATLNEKENKLKTDRLEANNEVAKMKKILQEGQDTIPKFQRDLGAIKLEDPGPGTETIAGVERPPPLVIHNDDELAEIDVEELRARYKVQKGRFGDKKPDLKALMDYKAKEDLYIRRAQELDEITSRRNEMRTVYEQLKKKRGVDFLSGFNTITAKLKEMYQMITQGGDAELELVDSLDPFTEGIIFSVRPPSKSWKNISNLSGGEKTLSSLALVFALHYYKPTPLYVMDEIDAALDFKNVSIVANYIKNRTKNAQFIIISLRCNMFEVANRLVGIFKPQDCTQSVTINNTDHA